MRLKVKQGWKSSQKCGLEGVVFAFFSAAWDLSFRLPPGIGFEICPVHGSTSWNNLHFA